jgi:opacity protein-like surface antigen
MRCSKLIGSAAVLIASAFVSLITPRAEAQLLLPGNFYIGAEGGWTGLLTVENEGHPASIGPFAGQDALSRERFSAGYNVGGRFGYQWGGWRLEAEVSHRYNDSHGLQQIFPRNRPGRWAGAERHSLSEMVNLIYDFDLSWPVTPHAGGGIGAAQVTRNLSNIFGGTHDTVTAIAYQGIGGFRYMITPAVAFDIDYRYFATTRTTFISTNPDAIRSTYELDPENETVG